MTTILIDSINCRGIRDKIKRADILLKAREEHINILCLQETHMKPEDTETIKKDWNIDFILSGETQNSGGVLIAIDNNFEHIKHKITIDEQGRYIILDMEIVGVARFLLINIYAPNEDNPNFFSNLFALIEESDTKNLVIVGDWNLVLDFDKDTHNYKKHNNFKSVKLVRQYIEKLDLIDIWRITHEETRQFTWRQNFYKKLARLDFFLISENLMEIYANSKIKNSYKSDHCPIQLELYTSKNKKGKGIWKINNSLLMDETLTKLINEEIRLAVSVYACTPYNPEFIQNYTTVDIDMMIDIDTFWEVLQAQLRGIIIGYASKKKKIQENRERHLNTEIENLINELPIHMDDNNWLENLRIKQEELEDLREYKLRGALIRARWQQISEGEKPTKYFLNLENRNFISKHLREIKRDKKVITNPKEILNEMKNFYETLYSKKCTTNINDTSYANIQNQLPKLTELEKKDISKEISIENLRHIVFKSKNNKSPGPDGFSNEFFKIFWLQIKTLLLKLMNFYRTEKLLNKAQTSGIITCIPKGGKTRSDLKNWRPITLLNSIYKFYSGILAERMKLLLPKLINVDQKGFINGRFIGENTRLTYDIINECNSRKIPGLIILIDFEKAFDSISWEFIQKTLETFNFGEDTINWVRSLQINSSSKILQNGHLSEEIVLGRGCRQGDPISPYLFVLAAEFLAEAIRTNTNIKGITILNKEHKLSQYADDTMLFIKPEEQCIRNCMGTLWEFQMISGLKVNTEKTKVIKIGGVGDNRIQMCTDLNLIWTQTFTALGITYNVQDIENITEQNIEIKKKEILKQIMIWNCRNITPLGKITLIKSFLISKITHILLSLPTPNEEMMKNLEIIFRNFIWNNKPAKFNKIILENTNKLGGLKMTNLKTFDQALKISWLKRMKNPDDGWEELPRKFKVHKMITFGDQYPQRILKQIENPFWKDVVKAVWALQKKTLNISSKAYNIPLWYNTNISINFKKNWVNQGYLFLNDIMNEEGKLFTMEEMINKNLQINFLEYETLKYSTSKIVATKNNKFGPFIPFLLFIIGYNQKGCAKTYKILMDFNHDVIIESKNKWENVLMEEISYKKMEKSFATLHKMKEGPFVRYFQFKLLHKRVVTNKALQYMGIKNNSACPYCEEQIETIEHAFLQCTAVRTIWQEVETWLKNNIDNKIKIPDIEKILGTDKENDIVGKTILATKRMINRNRQKGSQYTLREIKSILKSQLVIEEYQSGIDGNDVEFLKTWGNIYNKIV